MIDKVITGKVVIFEKDKTMEKRDGSGTYVAHILRYEVDFQGQAQDRKTMFFPNSTSPQLFAKLNALQSGEEVKLAVVQKDLPGGRKVNNVVDILAPGEEVEISAPAAGAAPAAQPASNKAYDVSGVIRGNTVTNAVTIASAGGKEVTFESLKSAAKMVLGLHRYLEGKDIMAAIKSKPAAPAPAPVAPAVNTNAIPDEDMGFGDDDSVI